MSKASIPPIDRNEWYGLIKGEITHQFRNYVLQLHVHQAQKDVASGAVTEQSAVSNIYNLCEKYSIAVQHDLRQIFKTW